MKVFENEHWCRIIFVICSLLIIGSTVTIFVALDSNYTVEHSQSGRSSFAFQSDQIPEVNYEELNNNQQEEVQSIVESGSVSEIESLYSEYTLPLSVEYQGENYIITTKTLFSFEKPGVGITGILGLIVSLLGATYSYEKRVAIRLKKLQENPLSIIDLDKRPVKEESKKSTYEWE